MKVVEKNIYTFQEKDFFSAIRSKVDYAKIVILAARKLLLDVDVEKVQVQASMKLIVDKMSRLFFYQGKKFYSISFPFLTIVQDGEVVRLTSYSGNDIESREISAAISILDNEQFRLNPSLMDFPLDPDGIDIYGVSILEEIFQSEPSYVRYDCDPKNENGILHPLNHLDVNYSQNSTFKIGLRKEINQAYFEDFHNIKTACSFITH